MLTAEISGAGLRPGQLFHARYEVERVLGRSAIGTSVEARDRALQGERVLLKVLHPFVLRTEQEMEAVQRAVLVARQLTHANIARTFDFDRSQEGLHFITSEYIEGQNLRTLINRSGAKRVPFEVSVCILYQLINALAHAHGRGTAHLGLKPENVLLSEQGEVKLSDFGLAQSIKGKLGMTATGETVAAAEYLAPEQVLETPLGPQTDIYAFGLLAYELAVGEPPFKGNGYFGVIEQQLKTAAVDPHERRPELPGWFSELVCACLQKDPALRPAGAEAVRSILREGAGSLLDGDRRSYSRYVSRKVRRRLPLRIESLTMIVLGILVAVFGLRESKEQQIIGHQILKLESALGVELTTVKGLLDLQGSVLDFDSVVKVVLDGDENSLIALIMAKFNPNAVSPKGKPLVHYIVDSKHDRLLGIFHQARVTINARNSRGESTLFYAVKKGRYDLLNRLINIGANPDIPDHSGNSPLAHAVERYDLLLTSQLLHHHAHPDTRTRQGLTVLQHAVRAGLSEVAALLLKRRANPNVRDEFGKSPLHDAVPFPLVVAQLLQARADVNARDASGQTPLHYALEARQPQSVRYLLAYGASTVVRDQDGTTPEQLAARLGEPYVSLLQTSLEELQSSLQ